MSANGRRSRKRQPFVSTSWDAVATWYDGWVGDRGSRHHRELVVPTALRLLEPSPDEQILDVGCGQGVLAPYIAAHGAHYTGIDASPRLIGMARRRHGSHGQFFVADARSLGWPRGRRGEAFDGAAFVLSVQDMDPLQPIIASLDRVLKPTSRIVMLMTHPAFRQPRHSGWGEDASRGLMFRRIDSYLTPMAVPMKALPGRRPTRSFHRPISAYVNHLAEFGFSLDAMDEVPGFADARRGGDQLTDRAEREIPLFLGLRARRRDGAF